MRSTARLEFSPLAPADRDELHALFVEPEVRRYLWDDEEIPPEQTAAVIAGSAELFAQKREGLWAVRLHGQPEIVGFAGYWYFFEPPERQILFGLQPGVWGRGLAVELAGELLRYGFEELGLDEIVGCTDEPNLASQKVMERAGMAVIGRQPGPKWENLRYLAQRSALRPTS
jgi:ribosomal-protein-alanine N-acetyltransferase